MNFGLEEVEEGHLSKTDISVKLIPLYFSPLIRSPLRRISLYDGHLNDADSSVLQLIPLLHLPVGWTPFPAKINTLVRFLSSPANFIDLLNLPLRQSPRVVISN